MKTSELAKLSYQEQQEILNPTPKSIVDYLKQQDTIYSKYPNHYYTINDGKKEYATIEDVIKSMYRIANRLNRCNITVHYNGNYQGLTIYGDGQWLI